MHRATLVLVLIVAGMWVALTPIGARADAQALLSLAQQLTALPTYAPDANGTHCNWFAHDFVDEFFSSSVPEMGGTPPTGYDANEIFTQLSLTSAQGGTWKDITNPIDWQATYDLVTQLATSGKLVIAAWPDPGGLSPHGHLAIVMPTPQVSGYSGTYEVPVIAQAGAALPNSSACNNTGGVFMDLGLNCGFGPSKRPYIHFFEYTGVYP